MSEYTFRSPKCDKWAGVRCPGIALIRPAGLNEKYDDRNPLI